MTKVWTRFLLIGTAMLLGAPSAIAADAGHGRQLAQRWCASCHVVTRNQRRATEAPPFDSIARSADFDTGRLIAFLFSSHPKMPNMSLTRTEAADLVAYIGSFAR